MNFQDWALKECGFTQAPFPSTKKMLLDLYYTSLTKKQRPTVLWAEVMSEMTCESPAQTRGDSGTSDAFDDGATPHGDILLSPLSHPSQPLSALFFRGEQTSLRSPFTAVGCLCP